MTAGVHEQDMFSIISDSSIKAISIMFERTCDEGTLSQSVKAFKDIARINAFFSMKEELNHLLIRLCKYFHRYLDDFFSSHSSAPLYSASIDKLKENNHSLHINTRRHRVIHMLNSIFHIVSRYTTLVNEAWKNVLEIILQLYKVDALPTTFASKVSL
jgi:hypothetical protein